MAALSTLLTRLEPTTGLVSYVETIKPYHTKILDVSVEYIYTDLATMYGTDTADMNICQVDYVLPTSAFNYAAENDCDVCCQIQPPVKEVEYSCGYGRVWDTIPEPIVTFNIVDIILADESNRLSNAFVVNSPPPDSFNLAVVVGSTNRLMFVNTHTVLSASPIDRELTLLGQVDVAANQNITVEYTLSSQQNISREYTVVSSTFDGTNTIVVVDKTVPSQTIAIIAHTYVAPYDVPRWAYRNAKIEISAPGYNNQLFLIPTDAENEFNLSIRRNPQEFSDYLNVESLIGPYAITINKMELYQPGQIIRIQSSRDGLNDGLYYVSFAESVGSNTYVVVNETIQHAKDPNVPYDGVLFYVEPGFDEPTICNMTSAPDLFGRGTALEGLLIEFELSVNDITIARAQENPITGGFSTKPYGGIQKWDSDVVNVKSISTITDGITLLPSGFDTTSFGNVPFDIMTF